MKQCLDRAPVEGASAMCCSCAPWRGLRGRSCVGAPFSLRPPRLNLHLDVNLLEGHPVAIQLQLLGLVPKAAPLAQWVLQELYKAGHPHLMQVIQNPTGQIERLGDLLIWKGDNGTRVIGGLEQIQEQSLRIQSLVENVQATQILTSASLGALHTMSCLGMGVTGTSGVLLYSRLKSMNNLCLQLQKQLRRIQNHLDINDLAELRTGATSLQRYEAAETRDAQQLNDAVNRCNLAGHRYQLHLQRELEATPIVELKAVNYFHRCLLIALTTEVRCLAHQRRYQDAQTALDLRQPILKRAAKVMFDRVIGTAPERYLDPALQAENVSLSLLAEIHQQARRVEAISVESARDAAELFEDLRPKIFGSVRGWWGLFSLQGRAKARALEQLRFLMACLEETNRVESLRLRLQHAAEQGDSFDEWERAIQTVPINTNLLSSDEWPIVAYSFN